MNKDYKESRDKGYREIYSYKVLFGDAFDSDKYAITSTKLCRKDSPCSKIVDTKTCKTFIRSTMRATGQMMRVREQIQICPV